MRTPVSSLRSMGHMHGGGLLGKQDWGICAPVTVSARRLWRFVRARGDEALQYAVGSTARAMAAMTKLELVKNRVEAMVRMRSAKDGES